MSENDKTLKAILTRLETLEQEVQTLKDNTRKGFFSMEAPRRVPERPGMPGKRIHLDIYFAFAGDKEVYRARSLLEVAAFYGLDYRFGAIGGYAIGQKRNKRDRLHAEAGVARAQLKKSGFELVMFAYYLSADYERVPYVELWDPHEPEIDAWIESNGCIVNNHIPNTRESQNDDRDPKKRLLVCKDCKFRTETKERLIHCKLHEAIIPRNYTKLDVRNYLESARRMCDYPRCYHKAEKIKKQTGKELKP